MFHPDRCLHADVGMKQDLLHMLLLSYNHIWLKLGLEVNGVHLDIYGALWLSYSLGRWLGVGGEAQLVNKRDLGTCPSPLQDAQMCCTYIHTLPIYPLPLDGVWRAGISLSCRDPLPSTGNLPP